MKPLGGWLRLSCCHIAAVRDRQILTDCTQPASEPKAAAQTERHMGHPNPSSKRPSGSGSGQGNGRATKDATVSSV